MIFNMNIPCDKIFLLVLNVLTLIFYQYFKKCLHWSYLLKNKILELPYCTWPFLVTRSFYWYQNICPCDLGHYQGHLCFRNTSGFSSTSCPLASFYTVVEVLFVNWEIFVTFLPHKTLLQPSYSDTDQDLM